MNSSGGDRPQRRPGFPIRTPSDQRLVGSSPRLNAASHVLHRPTMPRHPPCALTTQHTYNKPHTHTHKQARGRRSITEKQDARVHYPVLTQHPHQPHTPHEDAQPAQPSGTTTPHTQAGRVCHPRHPTMHQHTKRHTIYPLPSKKATHRQPLRARHTRTPSEHPPSTTKNTPTPPTQQRECTKKYLLLRKGGDPAAPSGTATLLRLRPNRQSHLRQLPNEFRPLASGVTNFHDVTGGVYKARERIHRSVADLRLLATPTSRGRVADPDPN